MYCTWCLFVAKCTLGKEWAAWGECEPFNGISGNGTRTRYKVKLLPSRNGGSCENEPESEDCVKDFPTGVDFTISFFSFI